MIDLTEHRASYCAQLAADLGAEVIKPDPDCAEDPAAMLDLIKRADAIIENYPVGYLLQRGLGFSALAAANPRLILVSITGFGQTGPRAHWKSDDLVISASGGQMSVCGSPLEPPQRPAGEQTYIASSLYGVVGLLLALAKRRRSGRGGHVDISALEAVTSMLDHVLVSYIYERAIATRTGTLSPHRLAAILPCQDGHIQLSVSSQWESLVEWLQSDSMAQDLAEPRWRSERYRIEHFSHIVDVLTPWTRSYSVDALFETAQAIRFPWAPVYPPAAVLASPQLRARGYIVASDAGKVRTCLPYRLAAEPTRRAADAAHARTGRRANGGILAGVRVLDFSWVLAGPYATRILADFGAEVIKVQCAKTAKGAEANLTGYFNTWNRNKRSITLDMSHPEARDLVLDLATECDVVVENFSPRVMANWGLGFERFQQANPRIVMASISAMGRSGPWQDYVAFGPTLQGLSGLSQGTADAAGQPLGLGFAYGDHVIGLYATIGILAELERRAATGCGAHIDLSGYEVLCSTMTSTLLGAGAQSAAGRSPYAAYSGCYPCLGADRWVVVSTTTEEDWAALCRVSGNAHLLADARYATPQQRRQSGAEIDSAIGEWTRRFPPDQLAATLQDAGVAAGVVHNARDLLNDPQLAARGFFPRLTHRVLGCHETDRSPIRLAGEAQPDRWSAAPELGADNRYVFEELLGLAPEFLAAYRAKGIIA